MSKIERTRLVPRCLKGVVGLEILFAVLGFVLIWAPGCAHPPPQEPPVHNDYGYDFSSPDAEFKLDNDLVEISGLTLFDENHLAAIQDEHGKFYLIEIETGEISAVYRFAGKDDYEGIAMAGERLFALRSDGQIREIKNYDTDNPDSDKIETQLHSKCDAEGLAHDVAGNRLLIACKEHPGKGLKRQRAVYALDLESLELSDRPVFTIPTKEVQLPDGSANEAVRDLMYPLVDLDGFKPSALAVHPITNDVFVLSSVLKILVVLDKDGGIRTLIPLDKDMFEQPEGMAFLPNGDLFLSSEGVKKKARLVRINYRPSP